MTPCGCKYVHHRHGTNTNYQAHRCRCLPCQDAHRDAYRAHRRGERRRREAVKTDYTIVGLRRRLRALAYMGYSILALERETGVNNRTLALIRLGTYPHLPSETTQLAIVAAFERLAMRPATGDHSANQTRLHARRAGWAAPLSWDEDSIDDPLSRPNGKRRGIESRWAA